VTERDPVLVATDGNRNVPVSAGGLLLPGMGADTDHLPELRVGSLPDSARLKGDSLAEALTIGAAPASLRPLIDGVAVSPDYGLVATMRGGIELRFGARARTDAKWAAAAAVLADPNLTSLTYVDVRVPGRPAVGGTSDPSPPATPVTTPSSAPTAGPP
jgi:hypothetical protein